MKGAPPILLVAALAAMGVGAPASGPDEWTGPEFVAEHVPGGRIRIPLRGLLAPGGRSLVCWSEGRIGAWRVLVAERDAGGAWKKSEIAATDQGDDPEPQIARASDGTLVVAWGGSEERPGGGYCLLKPGAEGWTKPQPIHAKCEGKVALSGGEKVTALYIRPVTKMDIRRLFGDFIHDPPVQGFEKPAVAQLDESGWKETAVLEAAGLLRCDDPALAGAGAIYFRDPDDGPTELAWSTLTGRERSELVSGSDTFRYGTDAAVAVQDGEPVVAFRDASGVVLRRRTGKGWGEPRLLLPGWGHGIRIAATAEAVHVACAGGGGLKYAVVTGDRVEIIPGVPAGASCDLCLDQGRPVLFLSQQEKLTGITTAEYRIAMVRRPK